MVVVDGDGSIWFLQSIWILRLDDLVWTLVNLVQFTQVSKGLNIKCRNYILGQTLVDIKFEFYSLCDLDLHLDPMQWQDTAEEWK